MKKFSQQIVTILLSLLLCVTSFVPVYGEEENKEFEEFLREEFIDTLENDYLSMHYTLKDYKAWGIEKPELTFSDMSLESYQDSIDENERVLKELQAFDYNSLSERQKTDYDILYKYLNDLIALNRYPMLDFLFHPYTGVVDNVITNFEEYIFYQEEDFEDYFAMLEDVKEYLQQCLELTETQVKQGIFLSNDMCDEAIDLINDITSKKEDNALIISFNDRIEEFNGLSADKKEELKERNKQIIIEQVIPAFNNVANHLSQWRGSSKYSGGTANYPEGKEYYATLAKFKSSTDMSVEQLIDLCGDYLRELTSFYMTLYAFNPDLDTLYSDASIDLDTPEDILSYLQNHMEEYPKGPTVTYKSSYLDPTIANPATVAYYMQPPIDDIVNNVIKINGDSVDDEIALYQTLAHEGFPGHLYQITWFLDKNPNPIRSVLSNIGYTEGWAMYTEYLANHELDLDPTVEHALAADVGYGYVVGAFTDLGVNGLGWSKQELASQLNRLGLSGDYIAEGEYEFIIQRPGLLLPYGVGLAYFQKLRGKVYASLEDEFNPVELNEVFLTNGDRPFEIVEKDVDAYIRSKGKEIATDYGIFTEYEDDLYDELFGVPGTNEVPELPNGLIPGTIMKPESKVPYYIFGGALALVACIAFVLLIRNGKKGPLN